MEWLFGSLKKTPKPEVYVSNVVENDFNMVSTQQQASHPIYPNLPGQIYPPVGQPSSSMSHPPPYPMYGQHQQQPNVQGVSSTVPKQNAINPLESIPFKLSSGLDSKSIPVNEYQLRSIKSQLDGVSNRINSNSYNYTFDLERSVLSELNYRR